MFEDFASSTQSGSRSNSSRPGDGGGGAQRSASGGADRPGNTSDSTSRSASGDGACLPRAGSAGSGRSDATAKARTMLAVRRRSPPPPSPFSPLSFRNVKRASAFGMKMA